MAVLIIVATELLGGFKEPVIVIFKCDVHIHPVVLSNIFCLLLSFI